MDVATFHRRDCEHHRLARSLRGVVPTAGTSTHVPMREAIEALGLFRFSDAWTGNEQLRITPPDLPTPIAGGLFAQHTNEETAIARWLEKPADRVFDYADQLARSLAPDFARPILGMTGGWPPPERTYTLRQWRVMMALASERKSLIFDDWQRLWEVEDMFKQLCVEQRLRTYLRPIAGGDFSDALPWWSWNSEHIRSRFMTYRMNPRDQFADNAFVEATHLIFVDRADLLAVTRSVKSTTNGANTSTMEVDLAQLSPFLACALTTAAAMGITPQHMPKKEEIISELPRHWRGAGQLTPTMKNCMAKIIRDEDSQAGRGSDHEKKRKERTKGVR